MLAQATLRSMEIEILKTDGYGLLAEVRFGAQVLGVMDDFSMIQPESIDYSEPDFLISALNIHGKKCFQAILTKRKCS
ncbi:MAG: hypothetical protein JW927_10700 [Deltaproteobacteria bacterium]|nr:hypothetical protein [Deltaproteobacteria bacterium]